MSFMNWTPEMSVSSADMDAQHQYLLDIINRYHEALTAHAPPTELHAIFDEVIGYALMHFREEEALMEQSNYPGLARHRLIHQNLTKRIGEFQEEIKQKKPGIEQEILFFLKSWLIAHIMGIDKQYAPYVSNKAAA